MIDKIEVLNTIATALEGTDKFLVDLKVTSDNRIYVAIDGDNGIVIDDCIALSRTIEASLDRDKEDFELNVASAGADSPLKLPRQYRKNVGRDIHVLTFDGETVEGLLADADDQQFTVRPNGRKKKGEAPVERTFVYGDINEAKIIIKF